MPEGYLDRPEIAPECLFLWDAFWALSSDRPIGMSEGPIGFSSIDRFACRYGIDDLDEFDHFRSVMHRLDAEYLKARADKAEQERQSAGKRDRPD